MKRVRVVHMIQNLHYGGMERLINEICKQVDPDRVESHILCLQYLGRFSEGLEGRVQLHVGQGVGRMSMIWPRRLVRQLCEIGPDVIHSHSGVWYKASLAGRLAGVKKIIHTLHGPRLRESWQTRLLDGLAARRTDVLVAVSDVLQANLLRCNPSFVRILRPQPMMRSRADPLSRVLNV